MPTVVGLVRPLHPLHVYRHLLRETSYLPPVCRTRIEPRIRLRFRRHRWDPAPEKRLHQAWHEFRNLRAANLGDMGRMRRVIMVAFGRIGWRRHELFAVLRQPDQPDNSSQLQDDILTTGPMVDWLDRWNTEKILVFLRSQAQQRLRGSPRPKVNAKRLDPAQIVPPSSIWGKPLSPKAAREKEKKWWRQCAYRTLPPLPRGEWELLKRLATGQAGQEWTAPTRRVQIAPTMSTASTLQVAETISGHSLWQWEKYAIEPIRVVERPNSRRFRLVSGAGSVPVPPVSPYSGSVIGAHSYTPRLWRRLYREIWQMTAIMEKKLGSCTDAWHTTWGGGSLQLLPSPTKSFEIFEGVDNKGILINRPSKRLTKKTAEAIARDVAREE